MVFKLKPLALPKGTTILCPACRDQVMKVARDICQGEVLKSELFLPIQDGVENGAPMICHKCKSPLILFGKLLTLELGFMPQY